jgi:hypothetical protein
LFILQWVDTRMHYLGRYLVPLVFALLSACGGGSGGAAPAPTVPAPPVAPVPVPPAVLTSITLHSDAGEPIGLGKNYSYNKSNASIAFTAEKNRLMVTVAGDETWTGIFQTGGAEQSQLKVGMVADAPRYQDNGDWSKSSQTWFGQGRYCSSSGGWFAIDSVSYSGNMLTQITLRFVRTCNGGLPALHGEIRYDASDANKPPPPVLPVPATLWKPPAALANSIGSYAYFESEEGDFVGLGKTYAYDQRTAKVTLYGGVDNLEIRVEGSELWSAQLRGMSAIFQHMEPGYYPGVHESPGHNPVKGGLSWTGEGRGCRASTGWYAIDSVTEADGSVSSIDLRFEQHCEGRAAALRGFVHWTDPRNVTLPAIAANTAVGSWRAPAASLPANGNYLFVQSDPGEPLERGIVDLQTPANAAMAVSVENGVLTLLTHGTHYWYGQFLPVRGQSQFVPGNYPDLAGIVSIDSPTGALAMDGDGYGVNDAKGWLVIDSIAYDGGKLVAVDLRFEQLGNNRLGNDAGLLHGQLHWRADQPAVVTGPAPIAPTQFWRPPAGATPSVGNYIYMESDRSDFIGNQAAYLYTPLDSIIDVTSAGNSAQINLRGDEFWQSVFAAIPGMNQIAAGYYKGVGNSGIGNPMHGKFSWDGDARGCNTATSGVVVDKATYEGGRLVELNLRFEQHCENDPGAMRGEIHWSASDLRVPQGPAPIPSNLWRAPAGTLPAGGNYLYVQSDKGAAMGNGRAGLMTAADTKFFARTSTPINVEAYFGLNAESATMGTWRADLQAMVGLKQFQVGFYDRTTRYPFQNRAFGGLDWAVNYEGCNQSIGWFAIDQASYVGDTLTAVHGRFEHHCEYFPPASYAEFNWEATPAQLMAARLKPRASTLPQPGSRPLEEGPMRGGKTH